MRKIARVAVYLVAFLALPAGVGFVFLQLAIASYVSPSPPSQQLVAAHSSAAPALDPRRPTVAVVLGIDITEVADALAPYAVFQRSDAFNVVMVAEERRPVALTGGLDLLPHYSFAELDALGGTGPAVIVVPNVPNVSANEKLRLWLQRHARAGSLVMSVCSGAQMLAATGLVDGQPVTTHWGDIARIERQYPAPTWVRGQRYIDNGRVVSTAGILSGIDGSLHIIDRLSGRKLALEVARQIHYTDVRYLDDTAMEQFEVGPSDAIVLLNAGFLWERTTLGVALYDGMDEMALAAVYDTFPIADRLISVGSMGAPVTSKHGLNLLARRAPGAWSHFDQMLVPGPKGLPIAWLAPFSLTYTSTSEQDFPFGKAIQDLALRHDLPTARFAAKRLEYRMTPTGERGRSWWKMAVVYRAFLLGILGVCLVRGIERLLRRRRDRSGSGMNALHEEVLKQELDSARALMGHGKLDEASLHLERAHILGQAQVRWHVLSHWLMLKIAIRRRQGFAATGQVVRIVLGVIGSAVGRIPTGNTGGSGVSMFCPYAH